MRSIVMATILILAATMIAWAGDKEDCIDNRDTMLKTQPARMLSACQSLADQGDALGQYNLGVIYLNGPGVAQDYAEAVKWFRKAADQGLALGQNNLGVMYLNGLGVSQDYAEAAKLFRKAADQGYADAQHNSDSRTTTAGACPRTPPKR